MHLVIYNPSSFGGNYDYSLQIAHAYCQHSSVKTCKVLYPSNAPLATSKSVDKCLLVDVASTSHTWLKKCYFLYRSVVNPLILFRFLWKQVPSQVIFNDYEQLTSFIWVPLFNIFLTRHRFSVILHDPDRDAYLPWKWLSTATMQAVMWIMAHGFYHERLPNRPYYRSTKTMFHNIPHGIYPAAPADPEMLSFLEKQTGGRRVISIIGNIRQEKNYELVIEALQGREDCLLVAGKASNSSVAVERYQAQAKSADIHSVWIIRYLTDAELSAVIQHSDVILLYYAQTFTSQSGVLNLIAPFKKQVIVADTPSALAEITRKFGLGKIVPADNVEALRESLNNDIEDSDKGWEQYLVYASWEKNAHRVIEVLHQ